jgi:hypothetical protein
VNVSERVVILKKVLCRLRVVIAVLIGQKVFFIPFFEIAASFPAIRAG